jgi:hypothetical protein
VTSRQLTRVTNSRPTSASERRSVRRPLALLLLLRDRDPPLGRQPEAAYFAGLRCIAVKDQQGVAARRLAAFGVDYLVILGWIVLITTVAARVRRRFGFQLGASQTPHDKLIGHGLGYISLTLPVTLYFALGEHSAWHGTLDKHTLGIRVERASVSAGWTGAPPSWTLWVYSSALRDGVLDR